MVALSSTLNLKENLKSPNEISTCNFFISHCRYRILEKLDYKNITYKAEKLLLTIKKIEIIIETATTYRHPPRIMVGALPNQNPRRVKKKVRVLMIYNTKIEWLNDGMYEQREKTNVNYTGKFLYICLFHHAISFNPY